jgi:pimeloyl-ACP methyl ester carboxylesterase
MFSEPVRPVRETIMKPFSILHIALLAALTMTVPALVMAQASGGNAQIPAGAHYESHVVGRPRVIVFVHGFTGDSTGTWLASNGAYFPRMLATDDRVKLANVFVASYETHWTKEVGTIASLATKLFAQLDAVGVFNDHTELIFICHSLGGLVVERRLIEHPEIGRKTSFIQFFGTPHEGGFRETTNPVLSFLDAFGPNSLLPELRAGSGNTTLVTLDSDWRAARLGTIHRLCAIEGYDFHGFSFLGRVVPYFSGSYGCDGGVPIDVILGDHMSMVKPSDRTGEHNGAYLIFLRNYRDHPYYETRVLDDISHDYRQYLQVDCERTTSEIDRTVSFDLDPSVHQELANVGASLQDRSNIKDVKPDPPTAKLTGPRSVQVTYGFNGLDKSWGSCPGGGHATLVVHPTIQSRVPVPDGSE